MSNAAEATIYIRGEEHTCPVGFMDAAHGQPNALTFGLLPDGSVIFADFPRGIYQQVKGAKASGMKEARSLVASHYLRGHAHHWHGSADQLPRFEDMSSQAEEAPSDTEEAATDLPILIGYYPHAFNPCEDAWDALGVCVVNDSDRGWCVEDEEGYLIEQVSDAMSAYDAAVKLLTEKRSEVGEPGEPSECGSTEGAEFETTMSRAEFIETADVVQAADMSVDHCAECGHAIHWVESDYAWHHRGSDVPPCFLTQQCS